MSGTRPLRFNETELSNFQARYGEAVPDNFSDTTKLIEQILSRRTVRSFADQPVESTTLERIIAAAQSAPCSSMMQTWSVISVENTRQRNFLRHFENKLGQRNLQMIQQAPVVLLWLADLSKLDTIIDDPLTKQSLGLTEMMLVSAIDTAIAAQTAAVSAESLGLGVCYCGSIRNLPIDAMVRIFKLPPLTYPLFGMFMGYEKEERSTIVRPRLPQKTVLHRNIYKPATRRDLEHYNDIVVDANNMPSTPMSRKLDKIDNNHDWMKKTVTRLDVSLRKHSDLISALNSQGLLLK